MALFVKSKPRSTGVPARFEAIGEALADGHDVRPASAVIGRELARLGVDLGEALGGLRSTYAAVVGREPDFTAAQAICQAWGDETLGFLHQTSCEDPLTGLASRAHLRTRLIEIYRGMQDREGQTTASHALVVVDLPGPEREDEFARALRMVRLTEIMRLVFSGSETIGQLRAGRLVCLSARDDYLPGKVASLVDLLGDLGRQASIVRVWIEGLPSTDAAAGALLAELART